MTPLLLVAGLLLPLVAPLVTPLSTPLSAAPWPNVALTSVAGGFASPTQVTSARDGTARLFVVEQAGRVRIMKNGVTLPTPFLDISDRVSCCGERGLLSIVFPPGTGPKSFFYVDYTDLDGNTTVSAFFVSADPDVASVAEEQINLRITQPFANHNGGQLAFGPDGFLYVGMGDGGLEGDPDDNGQNLGSLLGKILRVDIFGQSSYAIPASNPFQGSTTARPEIWAYGLRNPWRFSFDRKTGDLFIGDVGQDSWEEVDFQPAGAAGGANYGWRITEGDHCYDPATGCSFAGITLPVAEYGHPDGNCAITGGFVYRGPDFARLNGIYFYADYCSGRVWGLRNGASGWETQQLLQSGYAITSFGEDDNGEIYAVDGSSGTLYRLVDAVGPLSVLTVPVVVDTGGVNGAHYVSELTLANRGTTDASVDVTFTGASALGSTGSGTFTTTVPAGRQLVFPDAVGWLRQNGLSIPAGNQGGTLRLACSGLSSSDAAFASVRTLSALPGGRAGLAYPALSAGETLDAPVALFGFREDSSFRTNLALVNAGDPATGGDITLDVKVFTGDIVSGQNVTLAPGQWTQLDRILAWAGETNGWATVERVSGVDSFYAYAVVNDNTTGDGSFVPPEPVGQATDRRILPVAVRTGGFVTELSLTNAGTSPLTLSFPFFGGVTLQPREQRFIPDVLSYLGASSVAQEVVVFSWSGPALFHAGARTFSSAPAGGTFGVAYPAILPSAGATSEAWVFGLKQDGLNRSNLAFGLADPIVGDPPGLVSPFTLTIDFFDGDTGLPSGSREVSLDPLGVAWVQLDAPLAALGVHDGFARVRAPAGNLQPFFVYGVVNDGASPGQGTGDGSFLAMTSVK